jgi:hypothetical protein
MGSIGQAWTDDKAQVLEGVRLLKLYAFDPNLGPYPPGARMLEHHDLRFRQAGVKNKNESESMDEHGH